MAEKTEQATPKKLKKAREQGNVPKSKDFSSAVAFTCAYYYIINNIGTLAKDLSKFSLGLFSVGRYLTGPESNDLIALFGSIVNEAIFLILRMTFTICIITAATNTIASILVSGFIFTTKPLEFNLGKFNVVNNIMNKFSKDHIIQLLKQMLTCAIVSYIVYKTIMSDDILERIVIAFKMHIVEIAMAILYIIRRICEKMIIIILIMGIFDLIYQMRSYQNKLKMDKKEIKDEYKESEGNPQVKSKRQEFAKELAYSDGPIESAKKATVVVTNPTHLAVSVYYDIIESPTPIVTGKGKDELAEKMIQAAGDKNVLVKRDVDLAWKLIEVEVGDAAPEETFQALANIIKTIAGIEEKVQAQQESKTQ